jgi:hypothetical protein
MGWMVSPILSRFTPEKGPGTHFIVGWADPRAGQDG